MNKWERAKNELSLVVPIKIPKLVLATISEWKMIENSDSNAHN